MKHSLEFNDLKWDLVVQFEVQKRGYHKNEYSLNILLEFGLKGQYQVVRSSTCRDKVFDCPVWAKAQGAYSQNFLHTFLILSLNCVSLGIFKKKLILLVLQSYY